MITHIVLLKVKKELDHNHIMGVLAKFNCFTDASLNLAISYSYGINNSVESYSRDYNYAFTLIFPNTLKRDEYISHALHKEMAENLLLPILITNNTDSILVFDY